VLQLLAPLDCRGVDPCGCWRCRCSPRARTRLWRTSLLLPPRQSERGDKAIPELLLFCCSPDAASWMGVAPSPMAFAFEPQFDCREEGTAGDNGCCCCYHRRCFQAQAKLPCTSTCRRTPRDSGTRTLVLPLFRPRCGLLGALRIRYRAPRSAVVVGVAAVGRREDTGEGDSNGSRQRGRRRLSPCQQQSWLLLLLDPSSSRLASFTPAITNPSRDTTST
jgi:hypothetical protein